MEGYWYTHGDKRRYSRPIVQSDIGRDAGELSLTFADLMEIRFLNAFREKGVSWPSIRIAAERVGRLIQSTHPFSTKIFKTDGRTILAEIADTEGEKLLDLVKNQWELGVISRFLFAGIRFNESANHACGSRRRNSVLSSTRCGHSERRLRAIAAYPRGFLPQPPRRSGPNSLRRGCTTFNCVRFVTRFSSSAVSLLEVLS
jgi:hypothetical protein